MANFYDQEIGSSLGSYVINQNIYSHGTIHVTGGGGTELPAIRLGTSSSLCQMQILGDSDEGPWFQMQGGGGSMPEFRFDNINHTPADTTSMVSGGGGLISWYDTQVGLDAGAAAQPLAAISAFWSDVSDYHASMSIGIRAGANLPPISGITSGSSGNIISGLASADNVVDVTLAKGASSTTTIAGDLSVTTGLILDSVDVTTIQTSAESFVDNDTSLMTSAAIDDRINTAVATTVGSAVDLTSEVSGILPVANGGTGASSLTDNKLLTGDGTSAITAEANATYDGTDLTLTSGTSGKPILTIENSNTDAVSPILKFAKTATGADADEIGRIQFEADDDADNPTVFAEIKGEIQDVTNSGTSEDGQLELLIAQGASLVNVLKANSNLGFGTQLEFGDGGLLSITTFKSTIVQFESGASTAPLVGLENQTADANGSQFTFVKDRGNTGGAGSTSDGDQLGVFNFRGYDAGGNVTTYAKIDSTAVTTSSGNEAGKIEIKVTTDGSDEVSHKNVITGTGHTTVDKVDIDLGYGTASTTTVAGDLTAQKITTTHDYDTTTFENQLADNEGSGEILRYGSAQGGSIGQLHYMAHNNSWVLADADDVDDGASQLLGIAMGSDPGTNGMLLDGYFRIDSANIEGTAVIGKPLYVSEEPGKFDATAPSGSSDFVRIVGYCIDYHTDGDGDVLIRFKPDNTWVEIA